MIIMVFTGYGCEGDIGTGESSNIITNCIWLVTTVTDPNQSSVHFRDKKSFLLRKCSKSHLEPSQWLLGNRRQMAGQVQQL